MNEVYERNLSAYLAHDFKTLKKGVRIIIPAGAAPARQVPQGEGPMTEAVYFIRRNFIASVPLIPDFQRSFYIRYLMAKCGALFG